jgi:hypothetical protein
LRNLRREGVASGWLVAGLASSVWLLSVTLLSLMKRCRASGNNADHDGARELSSLVARHRSGI